MHTNINPEDILRQIREKLAEGRTRKIPKTHRPPEPEDFRWGRILCFDQTLSNCGWALLKHDAQGLGVIVSGTIRPAPLGSVKGFEATFAKAVLLSRELGFVISMMNGHFDRVVLELPSVVGYRTESSLVAAVTVCVELDRLETMQPEFVSRRAAGALLCGNRDAPKIVSSELVNRLVTDHPTGVGAWTEHVRDAVFVGLKHLYEEEK